MTYCEDSKGWKVSVRNWPGVEITAGAMRDVLATEIPSLPFVSVSSPCKTEIIKETTSQGYSQVMVKNPPAVKETWVRSLGWEDALEKEVATHSSILACRIPLDTGAWWARVHGVTKSQLTLSHFYLNNCKRLGTDLQLIISAQTSQGKYSIHSINQWIYNIHFGFNSSFRA